MKHSIGINRLPGQNWDAWIAASLVFFTVAQLAFLLAFGAIPHRLLAQASILTLAISLLVLQAWRLRRFLPAHSDMLVLMLAWGGFGMLWGWQLDGAMAAMPPDVGTAEVRSAASAPSMHLRSPDPTAPSSHGHHDGHSAGHSTEQSMGHPAGHSKVYQGWFRWLNAMNGLMLLFAFPPSVAWARCLQPYRRYPWRLGWVLTLDAVGMVLGMMAGGRMLGHPLGALTGAPVASHHLAMLAGMLVGMYVTMLLRRWLAPLPQNADPAQGRD